SAHGSCRGHCFGREGDGRGEDRCAQGGGHRHCRNAGDHRRCTDRAHQGTKLTNAKRVGEPLLKIPESDCARSRIKSKMRLRSQTGFLRRRLVDTGCAALSFSALNTETVTVLAQSSSDQARADAERLSHIILEMQRCFLLHLSKQLAPGNVSFP